MLRTTLTFVAVFCLTALGLATVHVGDWSGIPTPGIDATGGPDLYGYTWIDSNEPGGPVYNWKDITTTGTLVNGLGDDNYVGPFPIGFAFHYYWYDVTQYYVGSNGYIKFGDPYNMASPFPTSIPLPALPNDYVAPYLADWDLSRPAPDTARVYRWNNADSLVVSYTNVHPWMGTGVTNGAHYFQVIFSRLDSSITFQYGPQSGTVYQSGTYIVMGIENNSGTVGLPRATNTYAPANYVVYFNSPTTTTYVVHDLAAAASANATSQGFFILNGSSNVPWGKVKNVGNQTETTFNVNCTIKLGTTTVYNQTVTRGPLAAGAELEVTFSPNWAPTTNGSYSYITTVTLTGDMNAANNTKVTEAAVMTMPGTMIFDDGVGETALTWQGNYGGFGMHFVPPVYPIRVDSIRFFIAGSGTAPFTAQILDDNGAGGTPGTVLFQQDITASTPGLWYGADVSSQNITFNDGGFFVGWQMVTGTPGLGMDTTVAQPKSHQGWEFTGVWAMDRNTDLYEIMIRAKISQPSAAALNVTLTATLPITIPAAGGSFNFNVAVANTSGSSQTADAWGMLRLPSGNLYGPVLGPVLNLVMPAGFSINRDRTQNIPGNAPAGAYKYIAAAGDYTAWQSWTIVDADSFPFTKSGVDLDSPFQSWMGYGEEFESVLTPTPDNFVLSISASPNPFNPTTTLSYTLPEAANVNLSVYDLSGRLVTTLTTGWQNQGVHQTTFDGAGLASGVYLCTLNAGSYSTVSKIVLMK